MECVVDALSGIRLANDGEVEWSAALALARLGSAAGRSTLLGLLDRTHLESGKRYQVTDESGKVHRYSLERGRIDAILIAAMDAASRLDDADLWSMIDRLTSDLSPAVRGKAMEVTQRRAESVTSGGER